LAETEASDQLYSELPPEKPKYAGPGPIDWGPKDGVPGWLEPSFAAARYSGTAIDMVGISKSLEKLPRPGVIRTSSERDISKAEFRLNMFSAIPGVVGGVRKVGSRMARLGD